MENVSVTDLNKATNNFNLIQAHLPRLAQFLHV